MIIKTRKDVCYPDGGRIVAGVGLRVIPVDGGYKVTAYEHTGRVVPIDAAIILDQDKEIETRGGWNRKYG